MTSMQKIMPTLLAALVVLLFSGSAWAEDGYNAVLLEVEGEVLLFQGDRYLPVEAGRRLKDGDRLMIMENSKARVVFDNDCDITWEGAKIIDVDAEACNKLAALWKPCLGKGGAGGEEDIVLTQLVGSALVRRDGQYIAAKEGQILEEGDELKLDGEAEISYQGACVTTHKGKVLVEIRRDACPIAELRSVKGQVLVDEGGGFSPVPEGYQLKDGWKIEVPEGSHAEITYFNGCDEAFDGHKIVPVDADSCPVVAAAGVGCTPAVFGNMTLGDIGTFIGTGIVIGTRPNPPPNNPPPPVSP